MKIWLQLVIPLFSLLAVLVLYIYLASMGSLWLIVLLFPMMFGIIWFGVMITKLENGKKVRNVWRWADGFRNFEDFP